MNLKPMDHDVLLILRVYMFKIIESNNKFYINEHDGLNESYDVWDMYALMQFLYINYHDKSTTVESAFFDNDKNHAYDYNNDISPHDSDWK